jgi:sRNA-binding regulator protein Hfq
MSFIQKLFTSRDNQNSNVDSQTGNLSTTFVGQQDRIWWNPDVNAFFYSDGNTPGGLPIGTATGTGVPLGPINSVQLNAGAGNFTGSTNLVFSTNVLSVVGNVSATGNIQGNVFLGNGSQLTGVVTSLGNAFATVVANGTSLVSDNSADTLTVSSGNNLVITGNATTDTMTIAVSDAPVFAGNVTTNNSIVANTIVSNGTGNIYVTGNLLPSTGTLNLGLPTIPWQEAYFGPQSITILDQTGNIGNSVVIENIAANVTIGTTGFAINEFGTTNPIFRIEALTGQIFSNAKTIIQNTTNADNTFNNGALQVKGGASVVKDFYVGGNIYGTGAQLSNVVNSVTAGAGITVSSSTGAVTIGSTGVLGVRGTTNQIAVANVGNVVTLSLPQNLNTTANVQLYSLTVNDLTILGNVSNVIPSVVGGKIVYVANSATNFAGINTSGLVTGNVGNSVWAGILYETTSNTWQMDIGNSNGITSDQVYAANVTANGSIHLGNAYNNYDFVNALLQGDTSADNYSQFVLKNHYQGANSSADIVAVANNGDDSVNYIDMGINSNVYANVDYAVTGFNDGYMYVNGGNLVIGTQTAAKVINFFTGGTSNINRIRGTVSDSGLSMVGNVTANNVIGVTAAIGGTVSASGNVTAVGNVIGGNLVGQNLTAGRVAFVGSGKQVSDNGNLTFNSATNVLSVTGNVNATNFNGAFYGNIVTVGNVSTTGNVIGAYGIFSAGNTVINAGISTTGNVTGSNLVTGGTVSATGNITGNYYIGNGSQLTGVIHTLGNAFTTVVANGTSLVANSSTSTLTMSAGNNFTITGNASTNIAVFAVSDTPVFTGNISGGNIRTTGSVSATGNVIGAYGIFSAGNTVINAGVSTTGNVTGNFHIGNGSQLTGVITTITPSALSSTVHIAATTTGNTANIITDATTANTANTIVVRDANGSINVSGWTVGTHLTAVDYTATSSDYWIGTTAKTLTITLPNGANGAVTGRQYQIADVVHSGNPGTTIAAQSPATVVGNQPSQQGQIIIATYVGTTWYLN